jgi:hypothetical protein
LKVEKFESKKVGKDEVWGTLNPNKLEKLKFGEL